MAFSALVSTVLSLPGLSWLRALVMQRRQRRRSAELLAHVATLAGAAAEAAPLPSRGDAPPLVSFVAPVYNAPARYLDDLLASFRAGPPGYGELVLSDDASTAAETRGWLDRHADAADLRIIRATENGGISAATNRGLAEARGEWVALIDHDDALGPFALDRIARTLLAHPECRFLYTDEAVADRRLRPTGFFLKPAWDEVLLSGVNYINHFSIYRRNRLAALGGLRLGFEGSQDYDLLLRYTAGLAPEEILHLPYPAYLWRRDGVSYSTRFLDKATANARRALAERYAGPDGAPAAVGPALSPGLHRVDLAGRRRDWPLVSVVIPSRDAPGLIGQVLDGLANRTDYPALEIIVVDNGSTDPEVLALYERWRAGRIPFRADIRPEPFNFARAVNRGIAMASGELVLLLNNDIEVQDAGWLKEMVACLAYPAAGIVGAKLLYPDRRIQHVGVIAGLGGLAGHWFIGEDADHAGPMGRFRVRQSLSVVTGACMLISRDCLQTVGTLDEERFAIAYNDVDFCLRAVAAGYRVVLTPFAELIHHESASRGSDETPANIDRFRREQDNLRARHRTDQYEDRAFNPWYRKDQSEPGAAMLAALPDAR